MKPVLLATSPTLDKATEQAKRYFHAHYMQAVATQDSSLWMLRNGRGLITGTYIRKVGSRYRLEQADIDHPALLADDAGRIEEQLRMLDKREPIREREPEPLTLTAQARPNDAHQPTMFPTYNPKG